MHPANNGLDERYTRQTSLPEVGEHGQHVLSESKVAIIGLGGLGSPVAQYLASAGVGKLVLVDDDVVSLSNLQRQVIHVEKGLGMPKVESALKRIQSLNSQCIVTTYQCKLNNDNARDILTNCDAVVDATDNYAARFASSKITAQLEIPLIYGAILKFEGQICVFEPHKGTACYQCLYPRSSEIQSKDEASQEGVLGPVPGIIGSFQALETLKLLIGIPSALSGILLSVNLMDMEMKKINLKADPSCSCSQSNKTTKD